MKELLIGTTNKNKLNEFRQILGGSFSILGLADVGIHAQIDEDGGTFEANAAKKAAELSHLTGRIVLADDSGLAIDYLGGEPGVDSAIFLGEGVSYEIRFAEILKRMKDAEGDARSARFVCVMALAIPGENMHIVRAELEGCIAPAPAGSFNFGYDPIFFLPEYGKTMAELTSDEKNKISHRGRALEMMAERLKKL